MYYILLALYLFASYTTAQQRQSFPLNTTCVHTAQQWLQDVQYYPDNNTLTIGNITYNNQYITSFIYDTVQQPYGTDIRYILAGETATALLNNASGAAVNQTLITYAQSLLTSFPPVNSVAAPTDAGQIAELNGVVQKLQAYNNGTSGSAHACNDTVSFNYTTVPVNGTEPYCTYNSTYYINYNHTLPNVTVSNVTYNDAEIRVLLNEAQSTSAAASSQELQLAAQIVTVLLNQHVNNVNITYVNHTLSAAQYLLSVYPVTSDVTLYGIDQAIINNYTNTLQQFVSQGTACIVPTPAPTPALYNTTLSDTTLYNSTYNNTAIYNSTLYNTTLYNVTLVDTTLINSTLLNVTVVNSTIANSTVSNTTDVYVNTTLINTTNSTLNTTLFTLLQPVAISTAVPTTSIPTTTAAPTTVSPVVDAGSCPLLTQTTNNSYVYPQAPNQLNTTRTCTLTFNQWVVAYPNWPILELTLGRQTYNASQLYDFLVQALGTGSTDPTITIAAQVIAAQLSIASGGVNAAVIQPALAVAQATFLSYPVGFNYSGTVADITGSQAVCVEAATNQIALFLEQNDCTTNIPIDIGVYTGTGTIPTVTGIANIPNITSYYPLTIAGVIYQLNGTVIVPITYGAVLANTTTSNTTNTTLSHLLNTTAAPTTTQATTQPTTLSSILAPAKTTAYTPFNTPNAIALQPAATSTSLQCPLTASNLTQNVCYVVDPTRNEAPWHESNSAYPQCYDPALYVCTATSLLCGIAAPYSCGSACYNDNEYCCAINTQDFFQSQLVQIGQAGCAGPYGNITSIPTTAPATTVPVTTTIPTTYNASAIPTSYVPTTPAVTTPLPSTAAPTVPSYPAAQTIAPQPNNPVVPASRKNVLQRIIQFIH